MMIKKILIQILISMVLFSCIKDKEFDFALIQTGDVTNITSSGATFHARVSDLSNSKILNYGFVWSTESDPKIHNSEKYIITGTPPVGIISEKISTTLKENVVYYVRAFIQNASYITYGKEVTFTSLGSSAPEILDFFPKKGNINDTLYIIGSNFSYITDNNKVKIGNYQAELIYSVQDTLIAIIPDQLSVQTSTISVSIFGNENKSNENFSLIPPILNDFKDKTGTFGSQITILGNNFLSNPSSLKVYFDAYKAEISEISNTSLTINVPDSLDVRQCIIEIIMNNLIVSSTDSFRLESYVLNDFNPKITLTGGRIILTGNNFSPIHENNIIHIGGIPAEVVNASINKLEIVVPLQDKGIYPDRNVNISVEVIDETETFNETLLINDKWFRLTDFPGSKTYHANCFISNKNAYIGLNDNKELWQFNPETHEWTKMNEFPGTSRSDGTGFCIGNIIYFGTGLSGYDELSDFWSYDVLTNNWEQLANVTFDARYGATGYTVNGNGYVSGGVIYSIGSYDHPFDDTWEYYPNTDSWEQKSSFGELGFGGVDGFAHAGAVTINETVYFGLGWNYIYTPSGSSERVFTFKPSENYKWTQIESFPVQRSARPITFNLNNTPYFCTNNVIYGYNGSSWAKLEDKILSDINGGIGFSVSAKAYIGLGNSNAFWEYDPAR